MAKRAFLLPLAIVLSSLGQNSNAAAPGSEPTQPADKGASDASTLGSSVGLIPDDLKPGEERDSLLSAGDDLFKFVIRRAPSGEIFAAHESHFSHSSHESHRSHYSSR